MRVKQQRLHNSPVSLFDNTLSSINYSCSSLAVCFLGFLACGSGYCRLSGSVGLWFFSIIMGSGFRLGDEERLAFFTTRLVFGTCNT